MQKEDTRARIVKTAMQLYARRGFFVSTNEIAKEAGIAHGSIFVHFPTRDELQLYTLNCLARELGEALHDLSLAGESLRNMLYVHIDILIKHESFYTHLISELPSLPVEASQTLIALHAIASHHFGEVIEKIIKAGTIKDIPIYMLFNTWIALLHYYLQNKDLFAPGESVLTRYRDTLVDSYLALIQK